MTRTPLLLAACAALVVAGCTSGKDPGPNYSTVSPTPSTATTSSTPTESNSPTGFPTTGPNVRPGESVPTAPAASTASSAEAAQSFETYYIRVIDWVYATSQPSILNRFYAAVCQNCQNFSSNLTTQVANGNSFRGSRITIERLALVENDGRNGAQFAVSVEIAATALQIVDSSGRVTTQGPASKLTLTNWMRWTGQAWSIVDQGKA